MSNNSGIEPTKMYTVTETAIILGVTDRTIRRWCDKGLFPGWRRKSPIKGSPRLIPGAAIETFIEMRDKTE